MEKKNTLLTVNRKRVVLFVLLFSACLYLMFYIFNLSSMTVKESAKKSEGIINDVSDMVASESGTHSEQLPKETADMINAVVRKAGHFLIFSLLGLLTYFLSACFLLKNKKYHIPALCSVPFCIVFAISDEIHQTFVEGRHGRVMDVLVDASGVIVGTLMAIVAIVLFKRIMKHTKEKGKNNEKAV